MRSNTARLTISLGLCPPLLGCAPDPAGFDDARPVTVELADPRYEDAIAAGRAFIDGLMDRYDFPGLSVAVGADGSLVWSESRGYADIETRRALLPTTPLRVHSVSKALTSFAVGVLVDQGRLDVDARIQRYVPSFPEKEGKITVRLLGAHLAGIRHYTRDEEVHNQRRFRSALESVEPFADDPLLQAPGLRHSYSSYGWNLIGAAVESVCGDLFPTCMDRLVFAALGMEHTGLADDGTETAESVTYYERTATRQVRAPSFDLSNRWPAGGVLSTPADLVRFGLGFLDDRHLSSETREVLLAPQPTSSGASVPYGIGWALAPGPGGTPVAFHRGGSTGGMSFLAVLPAHEFVFAIVANLNGELGSAEPPVEEALRALALFIGSG